MKKEMLQAYWLFIVVLIASLFAFIPCAYCISNRPNIVLIIADDMGADDCGAYGNPYVRTPNIDRLAREGMRFDRAFLTCSSCSPSRSSIITGRYPHCTGAERLHSPLPADQITFVEKLKAAGYFTAAVGKWHLGEKIKDRFDLTPDDFTPKNRSKLKIPSDIKSDGSGCEYWVEALKIRPKDKPFFLWLASFDPHRPYQTNTIPNPHSPDKVKIAPFLPDTPEVRRDLAMYYDEIARLDSYIGKFLTELEKEGLATNTVDMFISDNGMTFPRCKTTIYDSGIKTPLIVRFPGRIKSGTTCSALVSSIDIAPTILELAGLPIPETMQGKSFLPLFNNPGGKIRDFIFAEHNWHDFAAFERAVRDHRFKYQKCVERFALYSPRRCGSQPDISDNATVTRHR